VIFLADVRERRYAQRIKRSTLMKLTSNAIYALNPQYPSSNIAYPQEFDFTERERTNGENGEWSGKRKRLDQLIESREMYDSASCFQLSVDHKSIRRETVSQ